MTKWKLAVVQDDFNGTDNQLKLMESHIIRCVERYPEVKLIVFPEAAASGYLFSETHVRSKAEPADGEGYMYLSRLAEKYDLYICYGFIEKKETGIFNSINLIGPDGSRLATYQKIHLTPLEKHLFSAGDTVVTVETELGTIGLLICWDMAFPELSRLLEMEGADILLAPSAWESPHEDSYARMASARAMDNTVYLATCNYTAGGEGVQFFGRSAIYSPDGGVMTGMPSDKRGLITTDIDVSQRRKLQEDFYSMRSDERKDLYTVQWKGKNNEI